MIVKNELEQWVGCTVCLQRIELRRKTLANSETMLLIVEHLEREHRECEMTPSMKKRRDREFSRAVREELARIGRATLAQA